MNKALRVGILAGESSGDILGAGLMSALLKQHPEITFEGIGGPLMTAQGLESQVPMERLSVMGLIDPLKRLPELLSIRKKLKQHFLQNPPDVFIGIDSPEFNLGLEIKLKQAGIPTVHYVSPSVWAWRGKRIKKIAKAVNLVLTLFPFEVDIYSRNNIPSCFVGHPIADIIPFNNNILDNKVKLNINSGSKVLALLPGSRKSEVERLAPAFLRTAQLCKKHWPDLQIIMPCANLIRKKQVQTLVDNGFSDLAVMLTDGQSREVMAAADMVLIASGTATLEALLLKKPMLVCYRMGAISYAIISRLLKVPYFSLPNLLAGKKLVDELVQGEVNEDNLFNRIKELMEDEQKQEAIKKEYDKIHQTLRQNASKKAAQEILNLVEM
jgi:lipid-A-disaccharide synthase